MQVNIAVVLIEYLKLWHAVVKRRTRQNAQYETRARKVKPASRRLAFRRRVEFTEPVDE